MPEGARHRPRTKMYARGKAGVLTTGWRLNTPGRQYVRKWQLAAIVLCGACNQCGANVILMRRKMNESVLVVILVLVKRCVVLKYNAELLENDCLGSCVGIV